MPTGYYLLDNPNPNAPIRAVDGTQYRAWFRHPNYRGDIDYVFLHVAATTPDIHPPDTKAENVAGWQSRTKYIGSYNALWDSDSELPTLPDPFIAYSVGGRRAIDNVRFNNISISGSWAADRRVWDEGWEFWSNPALNRGARWVAERCLKYKLPIIWRSRADIHEGRRGISTHAAVDPVNRAEDPGTNFNSNLFIGLVKFYAGDPKKDDMIQFRPHLDDGVQTQFYHIPNGSKLYLSPAPHTASEAWVRIWVDNVELVDPMGRAAHHILRGHQPIPILTKRPNGAGVGILATAGEVAVDIFGEWKEVNG